MKAEKFIPMLACKNAEKAIEFYKNAFGATEIFRIPDGNKIAHSEMTIGDVEIMVADEYPEIGVNSPETTGGCPLILLLIVDDVDGFFNNAVKYGAKVDRPVADQLGGEIRNGKLIDPFGYKWMISTRRKIK